MYSNLETVLVPRQKTSKARDTSQVANATPTPIRMDIATKTLFSRNLESNENDKRKEDGKRRVSI